jgi:hypothetical protein
VKNRLFYTKLFKNDSSSTIYQNPPFGGEALFFSHKVALKIISPGGSLFPPNGGSSQTEIEHESIPRFPSPAVRTIIKSVSTTDSTEHTD